MKKTAITIFAAFSLLLVPSAVNAQDSDKPLTERLKDKVMVEKVDRSEDMEARLIEIKNMDVSEMDFSEKRELRKEVREIKKSSSAAGGGVYISIGGLLLVIILLIILL